MRVPVALVMALAAACYRPPPSFAGRTDSEWIAVDVEVGNVHEEALFMGFIARSKAAGCRIDRIHGPYRQLPERRGFLERARGVMAYCPGGDLALWIHDYDHAFYGCRRPLVDETTCRLRLRAVLFPDEPL